MVGMFGGVKLGGGGKLVMGEVCSIRIIKSVAHVPQNWPLSQGRSHSGIAPVYI